MKLYICQFRGKQTWGVAIVWGRNIQGARRTFVKEFGMCLIHNYTHDDIIISEFNWKNSVFLYDRS